MTPTGPMGAEGWEWQLDTVDDRSPALPLSLGFRVRV